MKKYSNEKLLKLKNKAVLAERFYVPNSEVTSRMIEAYTTEIDDCDYDIDEFGDQIEISKELLGYKEFNKVTAFHRGDLLKHDKIFRRVYRDMKVVDIRATPEMNNDYTHSIKLTKDQLRVCKEWYSYGFGILKAPPRYGKTIALTRIMLKLGLKTLVLAHQQDLLDQFYRTLEEFTDITEYDDGVTYLSSKNWGDIKKYDVCLSTWQLFNKSGKNAMRRYRDAFGLVIVDECFTYDTSVLIDYNKAVPIGDIIHNKSITHVLSYDLKNRKIIKRKILRKIIKEHTGKIYNIFIGQNKVSCSPHHEFVIKYKRNKIKAKDLNIGDELIMYDGFLSQYYSCEECGELFESMQQCNMHKYKIHGNPNSKKHYKKCPICGDKVHKYSFGFHTSMHNKKFYENHCSTISKKLIKFYTTELGKKSISNLSNNRRGKNNPLYKNKTKKQTQSIIKKSKKGIKKWWNSLSSKEYSKRVKTFINAPSYKFNPNVCEKNIIKLKINNLKFVGNGNYFVSMEGKKKNPDFIAINNLSKNGRTNKVIEVMDFEYWHSKREAFYLKKRYKKLGINCLIIDAKKCYKKQDLIEVRAKIESFINNHYVKITKIDIVILRKPKLLYNLEVYGTHNYFVVADTLRNGRYRKKLGWKPTSQRNEVSYFDSDNFKRIPILVGNCHRSTSDCYRKVVGRFNPKYRLGCTATDKRKDMTEPMAFNIIGPVVTEGKMNKVACHIYIHQTGFDPKLGRNFMWHTLEKRIAGSATRNDMIINWVKKDLKNDKDAFIIIATRPVAHVRMLVKKLDRLGISATEFYGNTPNREEMLNRTRKGKYKVIVANRQMLPGINVQRWTHFYNVMPSSNAPQYEQEFSRVRTPCSLRKRSKKTKKIRIWIKKRSVIRDFTDKFGASYGCLKVRMGVYEKEKEEYEGDEAFFIKFINEEKNNEASRRSKFK